MAVTQANREFKVKSPLGDDVLLLRQLTGSEQLGRLFTFTLDLLSEDTAINMADILGQSVTVEAELPERGGTRFFNGICTRFSQVGYYRNFVHYQAQLRPWFWLLTRTADCKIFQNSNIPDVIKTVFRDAGFTDFEDKLNRSYREWEYLVQYRETAFNFVSRLMEQEGIYYYFKHEDGKHQLVLSDDYSSHEPFPSYDTVQFFPPDEHRVREEDHLSDWVVWQEVQTTNYKLNNYDFEKPQADLNVANNVSRDHAHADKEVYDFFGEYKAPGDGQQYVQNRIQELQAQYELGRGSGNCRGLSAGCLFSLENYIRDDQNREYLIVGSTYHLQQDWYETGGGGESGSTFMTTVTAMESRTPFRSPRVTPKPVAHGPHRAVVVGPSSKKPDDVYTDKHGRIKVQYLWDRYGEFDENSTCWMRVKQTWAGPKWGAQFLPRIGHEVIVDFIEGDPDRPFVVGSVYNGDNKPTYEVPDGYESGIKTRSWPKGNPKTFNELRFNDKKGEELIYFHAEKDFERVVENNDTLKVGFDDKDNGDQEIEIYNDRKIIVGNNETREIGYGIKKAGNQTEKVYNNRTITIGNNDTETVEKGDDKLTVKMGDHIIKVSMGKTEHQAMKSIELKCGASSIKMDPKSITIKSPMITIKADATCDIKSPMTTVKGDAMLTLKGGITMIN